MGLPYNMGQFRDYVLGCKSSRSHKYNLKYVVAAITEHELLLTLVNKGVQGRVLTWENTMGPSIKDVQS